MSFTPRSVTRAGPLVLALSTCLLVAEPALAAFDPGGPQQPRLAAVAPGSADAVAQPVPAAAPARAPSEAAPAASGRHSVFARIGGLELATPTPDPLLIGFHQASKPGALTQSPVGSHVVLPSRGRGRHPASAVDLAVRPGEPIDAVVSGTVVEARPYALYGRYPDELLRIRPDAFPDRIVTMLHVTGLRVAVGDHVVVGETIVAERGTEFPFLSQIDGLLGGVRHPHVHVEVR